MYDPLLKSTLMILIRICLVGLSGLAAAGCGSRQGEPPHAEPDSGPDAFSWETVSPESVGMDGDLLNDAVELIDNEEVAVKSMLVVKQGKIVLEHYFKGDEDTLHSIESSTKSIVSLLVGIAIDAKSLDGVDAPVLPFFDGRTFENPSPEKSSLTIGDLLTMQSGLDYDNASETFMDAADPVQFILDHRMRASPGAEWAYSSADTQLLGAILTETSGLSLRELATQRLFDRIGVTPGEWLQDSSGAYVAGYGLSLTTRDMARIGLLMLNEGRWDGEQLVSEQWIEESIEPRAETPWSRGDVGYSWWIKPFEGYCAGGRFGQQINFFPERDLVVIYTAELPMNTSDEILDALTQVFILGTMDREKLNISVDKPEDPCGSTEMTQTAGDDIAPFAQSIAAFGDGVSTQCLHDIEARTLCLKGLAADAGTGYENWGAVVALQLAEADGAEITSSFDAEARGIAGVRFTVTGMDTLRRGLRVGMTMVDQDGLPFEANAYVLGGSWSGDITGEGDHELTFDALGMPDWVDNAMIEDGRPFDPARIHSLRFQVPTQPGMPYAYDFCISDVTWLDADSRPIEFDE